MGQGPEKRKRGESENVDEKKWVYDSSVDHKGRIPLRASTGVWKASLFIIAIEFSERLSYFGIATNLIIYLTKVLHQDLKMAAKNVNYWSGVTLVVPLIGGFLADAYMGRFYTVLVSSFIYLLGLSLLTMSQLIPSLKPCNMDQCTKPTKLHEVVFFLAIYMISVGTGGHKPSLESFGADQFDDDHSEERKKKMSFFNWWNFGLCSGLLLGVTVIVYVQDYVSWGVADIILSGVMAISIVVFYLGRPLYRYRVPEGSPLTAILQVLVAAISKRNLPYPSDPAQLHEVPESQNTQGRLLSHTTKLRFLDKAAILENQGDIEKSSIEKQQSPWKLATVTKVEEMKLILNMVPIWLTCLTFGICVAQTSTFFIKQGNTMNRKIGHGFEIPPASVYSLAAIGMIITVTIYDKILIPVLRSTTGNERGIKILQRIGIGMAFSSLSMIVAALVERRRLKVVERGLIVELNLSSCYDLVEQFCGCILKQLSVMQKQMECPEECREAVPSLMFAAARFADLPELRDLRHVFAERFEKSLESFVNQEFVEKLASKPPTKDKKIQLMRDIAQEFSIKWDFKAFEHKMSSPPAPSQDRPKKHGSVHDSNDDGYKSHNGKDDAVPKTENQEVSSRGRRQPTGDQLKPHNEENTVLKRNNQDLMSHGRQELTDDGYNPHNARGSTVLKGDKPDVLSHGRRKQTRDGNKSSNGREDTVLRRGNQDVSSRGQRELTGDGYKLCSDREDSLLRRNHQDLWSCGRREFTEDMYKPKRGTPDGLSHGRRECINDGHKLCNGREDIVPKRDNGATPSEGRMEFTPTYPTRQQVKAGSRDIPVAGDNNFPQNHADSINKVFKEDTESMKPLYNNAVPPVKMRGSKHRTSSEAQHTSPDCNEAPTDPPIHNRDITKNRSERTHTRCDRVDYGRQPDGPARVNDYGDGKGPQRQNDVVDDAKPKPRPRSVRRRHKPPPGHDDIGNLEYDEAAKRNPSGRTREDARRGLQTLLPDHDPMDEEEKMMDKLLIHYSKKTSTYEPHKVRMGLKAPPLHQIAADNAESPRYRSRHGANFNSESTHAPARVMSLPPEPTVPKEVARAPARASSFQPEMLNPAPHVHPKLPDYDDLAAQFAALRGR